MRIYNFRVMPVLFIYLFPSLLRAQSVAYTTVYQIPVWIWWLLGVVVTVAFFYFLVHLELGRRLNAMTAELRQKNQELVQHKEHLEESIRERTESLRKSEEKFRMLAENVTDVIWTMDQQGKFIYISPSIEHVRGFKPEELIGCPLENTMTADSAVFVRRMLAELIKSDDPGAYARSHQRFELQQPHKDGHLMWSEVVTTPLFDDEGKISGFQGVTRDITERKKTENRLRLYHKIFLEANDGITIADAEGHLIECNPAFQNKLGQDFEKVKGKHFDVLTTTVDRDRIQQQFSEKGSFSGEVKTTDQNFIIDQSIFPIRDDDGKISCYVGIGRDVTARKKTEEALRLANEKLREANENLKMTQSQLIQSEKMASLGLLTAGIAHEINNPVNYVYTSVLPLSRDIEEIKTLVNMCRNLNTTEDISTTISDIKEYSKSIEIDYLFDEVFSLVRGIREGADRTKEIVEGLRQFSRLDADTLRPANIHEGLDSTLMLLRSKIKNQVSIHKQYGEIPPLDCYPGKLNQVFMNILSNAVQAIESKGDIFIRTWKDQDQVCISIKDTGRGMSEQVQKRIFEPFFTTKGVGQGTGLGLSISYGIIKDHNGKIEVTSDPGKGADFVIKLPVHHQA